MVKVITGIRRCGKSTLLCQIMDEIRAAGVPQERVWYINFEDYKYRAYCEPGAFYEYVESSLTWQEKQYLFFDEIQNVNDLLKDIVMRNKVTSPQALERVLDYLVGNSSSTISGNKISEAISDKNQKVSAPTVYDYIKYVEEACICDKVPRYDILGKKQLAFEEKAYVCDLGFFYLKKNRVKDEYNYIVETICYNELITRGYKVYVSKTYRGEVDFIAWRGKEKIYVQAAYYLADEAVIEREFGAYRVIEDNYPKYVVSMDKVPLSRDGIIHKNLMDFLLER